MWLNQFGHANGATMGRWTACWVDSKTRVWWFPTRYQGWWALYYLHDRAYVGAPDPSPGPDADRLDNNQYPDIYDWENFLSCADEEAYWLHGGWQFVGWECWTDGNTYCTHCGRAPANYHCTIKRCGRLLCMRDKCHERHAFGHRFASAPASHHCGHIDETTSM